MSHMQTTCKALTLGKKWFYRIEPEKGLFFVWRGVEFIQINYKLRTVIVYNIIK